MALIFSLPMTYYKERNAYYMTHSIHERRYLFESNPMQKYCKLKQLPGRGLLNNKNYATYYRSARVQVCIISKYFLLYQTIFSVYLGLSWFILVYF